MIHRFNAMADQLDHLKIQVYEQELEKQEIEAINLRLQVNPHFILNCLNTIFSLIQNRKSGKYQALYEISGELSSFYPLAYQWDGESYG